MNEEEIKKIIQEELSKYKREMEAYYKLFADRVAFSKNLQILDTRDIQLGRSTGTKIATDTDQKLGFYGVDPVDQPATIDDPTGAGTAGVDTPARAGVIAIIDRLQELGLIA